jgi:hypothetical protein
MGRHRSSKLGRAGMGMLGAAYRRASVAAGALALGAAVAAMVPGCVGDEALPSPCESAYAGLCGTSCLDDSGCASGLYCGANSLCTADCTQGGMECGFDVSCSPSGRCGGDSGSGFGPEGEEASGCADVDVTFDRITPTVVLLIDQSGSMTEDFGGAGTRWNVLHDALMDPQTGFVRALENEIRFGLALYTSHDGNAGGACPILTRVEAAMGNYEAIAAMYGAANPDDETPTGESILAVVDQLKQVLEPGPKMIVLATDGMPDTCAEPNPQNGQQESVDAAKAAFAEGIKTVVVSVGPEVSQDHLQDMANAGAGVASGAEYYQALDQGELIGSFDKIINGVRACVFTLNGKVTGDPAVGTVLLDGQPLSYNDPNGWRLNNESEIEIVGEACQQIQDGEHSLKVTFPCGTVETTPE